MRKSEGVEILNVSLFWSKITDARLHFTINEKLTLSPVIGVKFFKY